jgi:uncharacterized membrane protein YccC
MTAPPPPHPLRQLFSLRKVQRRWIFAVRAGVCMATPIAAGWVLGDVPAGLTASLGAFTSLYGGGRPYLHRSVHLGVIAICFAAAVALGNWSGQLAWAGVLTVSAIAMVAVLFCNALTVGPPGAYMFVMARAAGIGLATQHLSPWRTGLLVLGGGVFSWLVHMSGTLGGFRRPERAAVMAAADAVAAYLGAMGAAAERSARHRAALALHHSWRVLVNFQPRAQKPGRSLQQFRLINRELHTVFADAMAAAAKDGSVPADTSQRVHRLRALAADPAASDGLASADIPPGHPGAGELVRQALRPGSSVLPIVIRVGIAVVIAGFVAAAAGVEHAYWAMAAAVLVLHQGFDWIRTLQRGIERLLGTWLGLGLAGVVLAVYPQGLRLVLVIFVLQFAIEMVVVRNYALAVVFITAIALTIASGGHRVSNIGELLLARGADNLIGVAVGIAVYLATTRGRDTARLSAALAATEGAVAAVAPHLASGAVLTPPARAARRDLQIRAIELLPAYDAALGGSARERSAAESLWPAVAAAEERAYRTLASCWGSRAELCAEMTERDRNEFGPPAVRFDEHGGWFPWRCKLG